jgi:hypothetical protein
MLCGLETHVCVAQTALDLLARGYAVFVAVDAVASRHPIDHETALRRLEAAGARSLTTTGTWWPILFSMLNLQLSDTNCLEPFAQDRFDRAGLK